jgi:hypothetical protein
VPRGVRIVPKIFVDSLSLAPQSLSQKAWAKQRHDAEIEEERFVLHSARSEMPDQKCPIRTASIQKHIGRSPAGKSIRWADVGKSIEKRFTYLPRRAADMLSCGTLRKNPCWAWACWRRSAVLRILDEALATFAVAKNPNNNVTASRVRINRVISRNPSKLIGKTIVPQDVAA